jgi:hypothetical protein
MSYRRITILVLLLVASLVSFVFSFRLIAGPGDQQSTQQQSPTVGQAEHHDLSPPLTWIPPAHRQTGHRVHDHERLPRPQNPAPGTPDRALQTLSATALAPATSANFDGIGNGVAGFTVNSAPPDTNGDVGPNHYVQTVNSDFAIYNKSGTLLYGPVPINTLWSGFGGLCQTDNDGDPTVVYDPIADRWVISQFAVTGANGTTTPYLQCVAVSQTPDPTGAYYRYSFPYTAFNDYPKMGVWPDGYYITFNMFTGGTTFAGARICAYDRAKMLTGQPATQQCFNTSTSYGGLLAADLDGARQPPAGSPNYIVGLGTGTNDLAFWKFHVDWTTPANSTFTGPTTLTVLSYAAACNGGTCIPQSGTTQQLDSLADRLMLRLAYRNFGDHESLALNHSVTAGSGVGVRWYELRLDASHNPSVFQQGTYAPDSNFRWMGSIAMDQQGNMGLGFSVSGSGLHPQIHYTGRLVGDAAGTMTQGEGTIIDGAGSQTTSLSRWGDYSMMSVDPVDDCTFWYTTEYIPANGTFNWKTRIASFKFPSCGGAPDFTINAAPNSMGFVQGTGGSSTSTISTTAIGTPGTVNLATSVSPAGPTASVSPGSVTAGGSSTLTVNVSSSVAAGTYTVTVTGTEGTTTHSTTVTVTVSPPVTNDFSISASPSSLSIAQGGNGTSTISTTAIGTPGTINLSASVSPAGPTASLNPTSVTAGGSSTLTVSVGSAVAAGSYTVTVTGTEGTATHSTTVAVTVTPAGGSGITNGGFESGLSGWTSVGTTAVVTSGAHGGTSAARVGGTSATSGDSSVSQTFTAPSGSSQLTFWYQVHCPDTITYDWATATLKDNTTGTTATVLPKVCTNAGTWVQASASVTAGHSYTLTLISHDDNYASDPTYAL